MDVLGSGLQEKAKRRQAPKAVTECRLASRNPDRVGHHNGVGSQFFQIAPYEVFKIRAADFFFEFPDELNIDRQSFLERQTSAKKRCQRRTLIVGGATAKVVPVL